MNEQDQNHSPDTFGQEPRTEPSSSPAEESSVHQEAQASPAGPSSAAQESAAAQGAGPEPTSGGYGTSPGQGYYTPGSAPWQGYSYPPNPNQWQGSQWQQGGAGWQQPGYRAGGGYQSWSPKNPIPGGGTPPQGPKKQKKGRLLLRIVCVVLAVAVVSCAGYGIYVALTGDNFVAGDPASNGGVSQGGNSVPDIQLNDKPFGGSQESSPTGALTPAEIYEKVSPSVVGVVSYLGQGLYGSQSQGSGIIMSEDGYIITNAHVVKGATRVEVVLTNGDSYDAQIIGSDERSDLAVLKATNADRLVPAEFGNSDELVVGERVCAIGNPSGLELQSTLTVGYVSALNRSISSNASVYSINCIQTDAAINPGNSGGPLINEFGQVVGINSVKVIDVDYEGIGFAIPTADAMPLAQDMIANGKVTGRPMLGISAVAVSAQEAQAYGVPLGIWVKGFNDGADIATKGVKLDDIITQINDTPVYSLSDCATALQDFAPGDTVSLTIYRTEGAVRNQTFKVDVVLMGS